MNCRHWRVENIPLLIDMPSLNVTAVEDKIRCKKKIGRVSSKRSTSLKRGCMFLQAFSVLHWCHANASVSLRSVQVGLPKSMVRRIMKLGEDTRNISNEALVIVVKAR